MCDVKNAFDILSFLSYVIAIFSLVVAIYSVQRAKAIFLTSMALQAELHMSNTIKEYTQAVAGNELQRVHKINFLIAVDLYCKYLLASCFNKTLVNDNIDFYLSIVESKDFKDLISRDGYCKHIKKFYKIYKKKPLIKD
ncbi:hypothetical protein [Helicobacter cetorum]|nr:hypothetical protein [Helicobacter cetorum]